MRRTPPLLLASALLLAGCGQATTASPSASPDDPVAVGGSAMYRGGSDRTGVFIGPAPEGQPTEMWRLQVGASIRSQPAVVDGVAYVAADDGSVYAIELATGAEIWRHDAGEGLSSSPAVADGLVVAVTIGGRVLALDTETGDERWSLEADAGPESMPAIVDDTLFLGTDAGTVLALDVASGDERWAYDAGAPVFRSVAVGGGSVYLGAQDGTVHAVDAATGERRWSIQSVSGALGTPTVSGDTLYVVILDTPHSQVVALATDDGAERWRFEPDEAAGIRPVVLADQTLYVTDRGGTIYALDPRSGSVRWSYSQESEISAGPAFVGGQLFVASFDRIFALDVATQTETWSHPIDASVDYGPAVAGGFVLAGTFGGSLYALGSGEGVARPSATASPSASPEPSEIVEFVRGIPSEPRMIYTQGPAVADDGTTYVLDVAGRVLVYDATGKLIREFGEPGSDEGQLDFIRDDNDLGNSIGDVDIAPDGTVWIANPDNFRVDQFTPDGEYLQSIGSFGSGDGQFIDPIGVAISADGKIYVVDDERDVIQRFSADGAFELAFAGHGSGPGLLNFTGFGAFGPDGRLWVADFGNDRIQAFDAEGAYLSHFGAGGAGPGSLRQPTDVAIDAAGRIYALEMGNQRIQVFEPDGTVIGQVGVPNPAGSLTIANGELYVTVYGDPAVHVYRLLLPGA
ncbi:MAG TPA: PQQ-binding-like beta-propeller repeat protein [Candidatus Limnocylindria bacterium]